MNDERFHYIVEGKLILVYQAKYNSLNLHQSMKFHHKCQHPLFIFLRWASIKHHFWSLQNTIREYACMKFLEFIMTIHYVKGIRWSSFINLDIHYSMSFKWVKLIFHQLQQWIMLTNNWSWLINLVSTSYNSFIGRVHHDTMEA